LPASQRPTGARRSNGWLLAGYLGVGGFVAIEALAREGGSASSLEASLDDQGTTYLIGAAYGLVALAPGLFRRVPVRPLPRVTAPTGLVVELVGLGMRAWSMRTLKASYSRTLRTEPGQQVIESGPYRLIRHPGYLGSLMTWTGFALTSMSAPVVGALVGLFAVYRYRILAEEEMLMRDLVGYTEYSIRTNRLIPFVW
jgi:protein-S-isoprenylcysteine O-methyltransferase Ste14